jgi:hypothetical protein
VQESRRSPVAGQVIGNVAASADPSRRDGVDPHEGAHSTASTANLVAAVAQAYANQQEKLKMGGMSGALSGSNDEGSKDLRIGAGYTASSSRATITNQGLSDMPGSVNGAASVSNVPEGDAATRTGEFAQNNHSISMDGPKRAGERKRTPRPPSPQDTACL